MESRVILWRIFFLLFGIRWFQEICWWYGACKNHSCFDLMISMMCRFGKCLDFYVLNFKSQSYCLLVDPIFPASKSLDSSLEVQLGYDFATGGCQFLFLVFSSFPSFKWFWQGVATLCALKSFQSSTVFFHHDPWSFEKKSWIQDAFIILLRLEKELSYRNRLSKWLQ